MSNRNLRNKNEKNSNIIILDGSIFLHKYFCSINRRFSRKTGRRIEKFSSNKKYEVEIHLVERYNASAKTFFPTSDSNDISF